MYVFVLVVKFVVLVGNSGCYQPEPGGRDQWGDRLWKDNTGREYFGGEEKKNRGKK